MLRTFDCHVCAILNLTFCSYIFITPHVTLSGFLCIVKRKKNFMCRQGRNEISEKKRTSHNLDLLSGSNDKERSVLFSTNPNSSICFYPFANRQCSKRRRNPAVKPRKWKKFSSFFSLWNVRVHRVNKGNRKKIGKTLFTRTLEIINNFVIFKHTPQHIVASLFNMSATQIDVFFIINRDIMCFSPAITYPYIALVFPYSTEQLCVHTQTRASYFYFADFSTFPKRFHLRFIE